MDSSVEMIMIVKTNVIVQMTLRDNLWVLGRAT